MGFNTGNANYSLVKGIDMKVYRQSLDYPTAMHLALDCIMILIEFLKLYVSH